MRQKPIPPTTRREFLKNTSRVAAVSALAGVVLPHVHAAEDNTINLALIGTGGRGSGAVANAMQSPNGPVKVVAMADLYQDRLFRAHTALTKQFGERIDVPTERQFIGFDAYKKAIDCLRPGKGDVAMLTGYAGFRPAQLEYAVEKGVNVFMEKSFAADPPGARRVIKAGELAAKKNLKIAAGLMCRHARSRQELVERIHGGELGEILLLRAYRMQPVGPLAKRPAKENELQWQIRHFTGFFWVSGGLFAEMNIHQIDELCWIKNAWPVTAHGVGGRAANSKDCSQNLDSLAIEWTFPDGTKATDTVRWLPKCYDECTTYVHGSKCAAQFPGSGHPGPVVIHKDQRTSMDNVAWRAKQEPYNAWDAEWNVLLDAIRNNKPHNEAKRAAMSNLADMMGRAAVHMGRIVTWEEVMKSNFQFFPKIDELTNESEPPFHEDAEGRYPVPVPGIWSEI